MEAVERGAECHGASENRQDTRLARFHLLIPQFEMTAEFIFPVVVEIEQEIETSFELQCLLDIEVGVNAEMPSGHGLMQAPTRKVGVGN